MHIRARLGHLLPGILVSGSQPPVQNPGLGRQPRARADGEHELDAGVRPPDEILGGLQVGAAHAGPAGDDEHVEVELVGALERVRDGEDGPEGRVVGVHGGGLRGDGVERLGDEVQAHLLRGEGHELEGVQGAEDVDHVDAAEHDDAEAAEVGALEVRDGPRGDAGAVAAVEGRGRDSGSGPGEGEEVERGAQRREGELHGARRCGGRGS